MPLEWGEVNGRLKIERFTIRNARRRLAAHGDPLRGVLSGSIDMLAALDALQREIARR
jgi:DNA primase